MSGRKSTAPLGHGPPGFMHGVDTTGILMSCFSQYSRAPGGAGRYSVCFQEGVSAADLVLNVMIKGP